MGASVACSLPCLKSVQYFVPSISRYPPCHPSPKESLQISSYSPSSWQHFSVYICLLLYVWLLAQLPKIQLFSRPHFFVTTLISVQTRAKMDIFSCLYSQGYSDSKSLFTFYEIRLMIFIKTWFCRNKIIRHRFNPFRSCQELFTVIISTDF